MRYTDFVGKTIEITTIDGLKYKGKMVELEGPEDSESGEVEIGINFAGGITMFAQSQITAIDVETMKYSLFDSVLTKKNGVGSIVDMIGSDYVIDIGCDSKSWDTVLVKETDIFCLIADGMIGCPIYERAISEDLCYETLQCLKRMFTVSSVPEMDEISDIEEDRRLCEKCPKSRL